ncbi:MAG: hypothetical protein A2283_24145 [Lentisphaerae bacterium RIFOXYA12_FULL_48_11]|nr:MAG: hypothetical protein A2283_24145 [Lentisphaerae bacterium RIFOXYA12_FULL_48_11]
MVLGESGFHLDHYAMRSHRGKTLKTGKILRLAEMKGALLGPFAAQVIIVVFAAMILDGGVIASFCLAGIAAHWLMVAYLAFRRRDALTEMDQIFVKVGFVLFTLIAMLTVAAVSTLYYMFNP